MQYAGEYLVISPAGEESPDLEHWPVSMCFPGSSVVKNPSAYAGTQIQSLGWEDHLEMEMAPHTSILDREIPWTEEPGGLQSMRSPKSQT